MLVVPNELPTSTHVAQSLVMSLTRTSQEQGSTFVENISRWLFSQTDETSQFQAEPELQTLAAKPSGSRASSPQPKPRGNKRKRPKAVYHFAHPPPRTKSQPALPKRQKLVLQLRDSTAAPAFDVVPAIALASRLERASSAFRRRSSYAPTDLAVVRAGHCRVSEDWETLVSRSENADDDVSLVKDMYGVISKRSNEGDWKVILNDGSRWACVKLENGNYILSGGNEGESLTAQWILRKPKGRRMGHEATTQEATQRRFSFSPLSEGINWRPFAGEVRPERVSIFDSYKVKLWASPETSPERVVGSPRQSNEESRASGLHQVKTTEQIRALITVSGIWVALQEGWIKSLPCDGTSFSDASRSMSSSRISLPKSTAPSEKHRAPSPAQRRDSVRNKLFGVNSWAYRVQSPASRTKSTARSLKLSSFDLSRSDPSSERTAAEHGPVNDVQVPKIGELRVDEVDDLTTIRVRDESEDVGNAVYEDAVEDIARPDPAVEQLDNNVQVLGGSSGERNGGSRRYGHQRKVRKWMRRRMTVVKATLMRPFHRRSGRPRRPGPRQE